MMFMKPIKAKVSKVKAARLFSAKTPHAKKTQPSHPHLKHSKLSVMGKTSFQGAPAFSPGVGGAPAFGPAPGGAAAPAPAQAPLEAGPPEAGGF